MKNEKSNDWSKCAFLSNELVPTSDQIIMLLSQEGESESVENSRVLNPTVLRNHTVHCGVIRDHSHFLTLNTEQWL